MPRKKIEVVELNKKEEKIVLAEEQSALILFFRNHRLLILLTLLILALTAISLGILLNIKYFRHSEEPIIKEVSIDTTLDDYLADISANNAMSEESAKEAFSKNSIFKGNGEVLLVETIDNGSYIIKYYSDYTAIKIVKQGNNITRIDSIDGTKYGIDKNGITNSQAKISEVKATNTKKYPWGTVTYYSDGSAEVSSSEMNLFVRNASDINDNYISNNKVNYLKETEVVGNVKLYYYYDGTIEVAKNGKSYLVRTKDDLTITNSDVTFKNNNAATIISSKILSDGKKIDYYEDGGAIIRDGDKTLSVRKSNSIIIKDNKIYEIVDNIYVEISKKTANATYYTNGGAVVNYNGSTYYVDENSNIKYNNQGSMNNITNTKEILTNETNRYNENVKIFEKTAVISTKDYIAIVPSASVIYDENGKIKDIDNIDEDEKVNTFSITNNTNSVLKYRVVIEKSPRTTVDVQYLRFLCQSKNQKMGPAKLNGNIWKEDDISSTLNITGTNYILLDGTIEPQDTDNISVMLWTDYDTIPNSMQDKYFYGTIKVYAWSEILP